MRQIAGCARGPGHVLIPHQVDPWARCGRTGLEQTVLLCEADHHADHSGRMRLRLKDGRWFDERGWADGPDVSDLPF